MVSTNSQEIQKAYCQKNIVLEFLLQLTCHLRSVVQFPVCFLSSRFPMFLRVDFQKWLGRPQNIVVEQSKYVVSFAPFQDFSGQKQNVPDCHNREVCRKRHPLNLKLYTNQPCSLVRVVGNVYGIATTRCTSYLLTRTLPIICVSKISELLALGQFLLLVLKDIV